jgi:hypothetical protein
MRRYLSDKYSSSEESEYADSKTDEASYSTDLTDVDTGSDDDGDDQAWLLADEDHPPEYYLEQLNTFDEAEYAKEDYKPSSTRLLDRIEEQWCQ